MDLTKKAKSIKWKKIEITQTGPTTYDAVFYNETQQAKGEITVDENPPPNQFELARSLSHEYQCDIHIQLPHDELKSVIICFDKPRKKRGK